MNTPQDIRDQGLQGVGASADADRAFVASRSSPSTGSRPKASIPCAELTYRLRDTDDPEERLEDAALYKALWDVSGGKLRATKEQDATFGSIGHRFQHTSSLPYWTDPAFLSACGREFHVCTFEEVERIVASLHARGKDAFIKSGFDKFFIAKVRRGDDLRDVIGDMAYSFIDSPIPLMVQELVDFTFEHRFFVFDRKVVTFTPAAYTLTPLDHPTPDLWGWRKQADRCPEPFGGFHLLFSLANHIAADMREPTASFDIGMIGTLPAVVEFNPLRAGQIGLFACDVRALATAFYASATEARRAETAQQGSVHDGAIHEVETPKTPLTPPHHSLGE